MSGQCRAASSAMVPGTGDCALVSAGNSLYWKWSAISASTSRYAIHWYFRPMLSWLECPTRSRFQVRSKLPNRSVVHPSSNTRRSTYRSIWLRSNTGRARAVFARTSRDRGGHAMPAGRVPATATRPRIPQVSRMARCRSPSSTECPIWLRAQSSPSRLCGDCAPDLATAAPRSPRSGTPAVRCGTAAVCGIRPRR